MDKEFKFDLLNSAIAGGLVFAGSFVTGIITWSSLIASLSASIIVFLTKLSDGLKDNKRKKKRFINKKVFNFI